jgi:glycerophosphoryl diester phosphodiesterase
MTDTRAQARPRPRWGRLIGGSLGGAVLGVLIAGYIDLGAAPAAPAQLEVIAHRGVHQDFSREGLDDTTCTAARILPPEHGFLENTLASMRAAFHLGATMVEIDLHETRDGGVAVFHDWSLECRTNGRGETRSATIAELKALDIGHGYSADGGATFPFRGKGVGLMPTLQEVLSEFPQGRFLLDHKSGDGQTLGWVLAGLSPAQRANLVYWGSHDVYTRLVEQAPGLGFFNNRRGMKDCVLRYAATLFNGALPASCSERSVGLPLSYLSWAPGWPNRLLRKVHTARSRFFVGGVDTPEALESLRAVPIDGIVTDHIERISPSLAR